MQRVLIRLVALAGVLTSAAACRTAPDPSADLDRIIEASLDRAVAQYRAMDASLPDTLFPRTTNPDGSLRTNTSSWWTSGFFPGALWYLYEHTGDAGLRQRAEARTWAVEPEKRNAGDHDIGFKIFDSFGQAWRLTGDSAHLPVMMTAARTLTTRFDPRVGAIRSWGDVADTTGPYLVIIDNMMNLELLFWATRYSGDSTFFDIAVMHADRTLENHFRPDGSSFHVLEYHPVTGDVLRKRTEQGFSDGSAWARGQAWGLYGYTMAYRETGFERYLDRATRIADFILHHPGLPADGVPYWDFDAPDIPDALRDASAAAITASALLELGGFVGDSAGAFYRDRATTMLRTLSAPPYRAAPGENANFLLRHGVGHLPQDSEVDVPLSYADHYYLEGLTRLRRLLRGDDAVPVTPPAADASRASSDAPGLSAAAAGAGEPGTGVRSGIRVVPVGSGWARTSVNASIFRRHAVVSHGRTQYTAYYDSTGHVVLARRQLGSTDWDVRRTRYTGNVRDAHNAISLGVDGDGVLHVCWDLHGDTLRYARAIRAGSLELTEPLPMTGRDDARVTYPQFYHLTGGDLLFAYRDGASGDGDIVLDRYDVGAGTWRAVAHPLIDGEGKRNAYVNTLAIDRRGGWHVSWTWRETWDVATNHDVLYAHSPDEGETWRTSAGEPYRLPITAATADVAVAVPEGHELINQTSTAVDSHGRPMIATYWRAQGEAVPQYRLVWHDGDRWRVTRVGARTEPFTLRGGGTKRIPISRPLVLADHDDGVYVVFRDAERGGGVSVAVSTDPAREEWDVRTLYGRSVGQWEPAHDPVVWERDRALHLFLQRVGQGDAETLQDVPPQPVSILEWNDPDPES